MNIIYEFIKYKWKAKARQGIHSPFIYNLIDKGIQQSDFKTKFKIQDRYNMNAEILILKFSNYFNFQTILIEDNSTITNWGLFFQKNFPYVKIDFTSKISQEIMLENDYQLIFISSNKKSEQIKEAVEKLLKFSKNETVFFIEGIRTNKFCLRDWEKLHKMELFHVTIDFYGCGVLIKRKQQGKEHFILKN